MVEENRNIPLRERERQNAPMDGMNSKFGLVATLGNGFDILDIAITRLAKPKSGRPSRDDELRIDAAKLALQQGQRKSVNHGRNQASSRNFNGRSRTDISPMNEVRGEGRHCGNKQVIQRQGPVSMRLGQ